MSTSTSVFARCPTPTFIDFASELCRSKEMLLMKTCQLTSSSIFLLLPYFWGSIEEICTIDL